MESEILKLAMTQGIFAVLFTSLLFYVLKENARRETLGAERETNYQKIIHEIADRLTGMVCNMQDDVKEIKEKIFK